MYKDSHTLFKSSFSFSIFVKCILQSDPITAIFKMEVEPVAHIFTQFPEKFGVPRQSGLAKNLKGKIVFIEKYRNYDALRGLDGFSHLWLIWGFSQNCSSAGQWRPTVRPPRLEVTPIWGYLQQGLRSVPILWGSLV